MINYPKSTFSNEIFKELFGKVEQYHVDAVLAFLFEEIQARLANGEEIHINNFASFKLSNSKVKNASCDFSKTNPVDKIVVKRRLNYSLSHRLRYKIIKYLDVKKIEEAIRLNKVDVKE